MRERLAVDVASSLKSDGVPERLAWLMAIRSIPEHIRSDIGVEFMSKAVRRWLKDVGVRTLFTGFRTSRLGREEHASDYTVSDWYNYRGRFISGSFIPIAQGCVGLRFPVRPF